MEFPFALLPELNRHYVEFIVLSFVVGMPPSGIVGAGTKNTRIALTRNIILPMRFRIFMTVDKSSRLFPGQLINRLVRIIALSSPYEHAPGDPGNRLSRFILGLTGILGNSVTIPK